MTKPNRKKIMKLLPTKPKPEDTNNELILPTPCFNLHQLFVTQEMVYILTSATVGINKSPKQQLLETQIKSYELA